MCLQRIDEEHDPPIEEIIGYKAFQEFNNVDLGGICYGDFFYKVGEKNTANKTLVINYDDRPGRRAEYISGFHFFEKPEDARKWTARFPIFKCKFEQVTYTGIDCGMKAHVANYMTILEEVDI